MGVSFTRHCTSLLRFCFRKLYSLCKIKVKQPTWSLAFFDKFYLLNLKKNHSLQRSSNFANFIWRKIKVPLTLISTIEIFNTRVFHPSFLYFWHHLSILRRYKFLIIKLHITTYKILLIVRSLCLLLYSKLKNPWFLLVLHKFRDTLVTMRNVLHMRSSWGNMRING